MIWNQDYGSKNKQNTILLLSYHHVNLGDNWTFSLGARASSVKHECYVNLSMVYYLKTNQYFLRGSISFHIHQSWSLLIISCNQSFVMVSFSFDVNVSVTTHWMRLGLQARVQSQLCESLICSAIGWTIQFPSNPLGWYRSGRGGWEDKWLRTAIGW